MREREGELPDGLELAMTKLDRISEGKEERGGGGGSLSERVLGAYVCPSHSHR